MGKSKTKIVKVDYTDYEVIIDSYDFGEDSSSYRFTYNFKFVKRTKFLGINIGTEIIYAKNYLDNISNTSKAYVGINAKDYSLLINDSVRDTLYNFIEKAKLKLKVEDMHDIDALNYCINLNDTASPFYIHIGNKRTYTVKQSYLIEEDESWVPGIMYKCNTTGKQYVRSVKRFQDRFVCTKDPKKNSIIYAYDILPSHKQANFKVIEYTCSFLPEHFLNNTKTNEK